jgi:hypothetical protein
MFMKDYDHHHPPVLATVFNEGRKEPNAQFKAGKCSVEIHVGFQENTRFFLKARPEVIQVRDEIARELRNKFGQKTVTVFEGREDFVLQ